ncbi:MAG: hypothetical protein K2X39_04825 [Silvanigrellaceae bacterium]|nr:hypothetical protein [Silvanigrellaceae bacterium]
MTKIKLKNIDDVFLKRLSPNEIAEADMEAENELAALKILQEDISMFVAKVMTEKKIGFRTFAKEHNLSLSMASKILKGSGNLTLETLAKIATHCGKKAHIVFLD